MITINNQQFKTILFDKDGTIFDSERFALNIRLTCAKTMGIPITEEILRSCIGKSVSMCKSIIQDAIGDEHDYDAFINTVYMEERIREKKEKIPLRSGVRAFIDECIAKNIQMGIVTSSSRPSVEYRIAQYHLAEPFQTIVSIDDVENPKPHAEPYQIALKRLKANPDETLVFEDSPSGVQAALAAGLRVVFVRDLVELPAFLEKQVFLSLKSWEMLSPFIK